MRREKANRWEGLVLSGKRRELIGFEEIMAKVGDARTCQDSGCVGHQEATSILPLKTFQILNFAVSQLLNCSMLQDGRTGHPTADPETSLPHALLSQVVIVVKISFGKDISS